jgi:hypothetical protein
MPRPQHIEQLSKKKKEKTPDLYTETAGHKLKVFAGRQYARIFLWRAKKKGEKIMSEIQPKPQILEGKLTYISLGVGALTLIFQLLGKSFPQEEANAIVNWTNSNWPAIVQLSSIVGAFWGRLRIQWRKPKA